MSEITDSFVANFEAVAGKAHLVDSLEAAVRKTAEIIRDAGATRVACAQTPGDFAQQLRAALGTAEVDLKQEPYSAQDLPLGLNEVQIGITGIDFAIAQSGTMVEVAINDATRLVSSMPRTHIGILYAREIVPLFFDAAARLRTLFADNERNIAVSFISGPSRTGDIEMILTLGVHGPEKAHVVVIGD